MTTLNHLADSVANLSVGMPLGSTSHNNYFPSGSAHGILLGSTLADGSRLPIRHNLTTTIREPGPESTPRNVVPPSTGGRAAAMPEREPGLHVCFGNPHPIMASLLREDHDVRQGESVRP